jgi:hypothetical protein
LNKDGEFIDERTMSHHRFFLLIDPVFLVRESQEEWLAVLQKKFSLPIKVV